MPQDLIGRRANFDGAPVLFVPGSFSTLQAWRGVQKHIPESVRVFNTCLLGYGDMTETRSRADFAMEHQIRALVATAHEIGEPVHLVAHSFGGTVAMAALLSGMVEGLSLTTFEANPVAILGHKGGGELFESVQQLAERFEAAHLAGSPDAAAMIIDYWGGEGVFASLPAAVQDYCRQTAGTNVLDWLTAIDFRPDLSDFQRLDLPVLLARGGLANAAMIAVTDILAAAIPNAQTAVVDGANHFLISSHAHDCARLLQRNII